MTIETVKTFFGWCAVINIGLFVFSSLLILIIRGIAARMHAKLFGIGEEFVSQTFYQYMGYYKIAIIVLNVVPYFALKIMSIK